MWERFTKQARNVIDSARETASRLGSKYVQTEHILLGLCQEPDGIGGRVLKNLGVNVGTMSANLERSIRKGGDKPKILIPPSDIAFTPRAKNALGMAVESARELNHNYIGTEHILLGLLKEGGGYAAIVLDYLEISLENTRAEVVRVLGDQDNPRA
ncbi:MAG: hypothetical protein HUU46_07935 [Candidatus Hydrogenedentes bacterium]|nr:hypothetical protein [Candidatus Hydrogenedentota bacterium]